MIIISYFIIIIINVFIPLMKWAEFQLFIHLEPHSVHLLLTALMDAKGNIIQ